ncbi:hypothetical protein [Limnothrix redekei]|uniref:Uncharacterized protein n=1 Tax=Limnothrix redekei LRLZ20PSL1 TaxID=3112953 RepID=A0ABW7CBD5_9CYAN
MSISKLLVSVLLNEVKSGLELEQVEIPLIQDNHVQWLVLYFDDQKASQVEYATQKLITSLLKLMEEGGVIGGSDSDTVLCLDRDLGLESVSKDVFINDSSKYVVPSFILQLISNHSHDQEKSRSPYIFISRPKDLNVVDLDKIEMDLRNCTWLGSCALPSSLLHRKITIKLGANQRSIVPKQRSVLSYCETKNSLYTIYRYENDLKSSNLCLIINIYQRNQGTRTEEVAFGELLQSLSIASNYHGISGSIELVVDAFCQKFNSIDLKQDFLQLISDSSNPISLVLKKLVMKKINEQREKSIQKIESRKQKLQQKPRISITTEIGNFDLGLVPTNEQETIILAARAEPYIQRILGDFKILDHTSNSGIDSLIKIRKSLESPTLDMAVTEFEYRLDNFFKHDHPVMQVEFIICWTLGGYSSNGCFEIPHSKVRRKIIQFEISDFDSWIKILNFSNHIIYVLPLEKLPGLMIH